MIEFEIFKTTYLEPIEGFKKYKDNINSYKKGFIDLENLRENSFSNYISEMAEDNIKELKEKGITEFVVSEKTFVRVKNKSHSEMNGVIEIIWKIFLK